jgi:hypothetical protein
MNVRGVIPMLQNLLRGSFKLLLLSVVGQAVAATVHSTESLIPSDSGITAICETDNQTLAEIKGSQDNLLWTFIKGVCGDEIDVPALSLSPRNHLSDPPTQTTDWRNVAPEIETDVGNPVIEVASSILEALLNPPLELRILEFQIVEPLAFIELQPSRPGNEEIQTETTNLPPSHIGVRSRLLFERNGGSWTLKDGEIGSSQDWYHRLCDQMPRGLMKSCAVTSDQRQQ